MRAIASAAAIFGVVALLRLHAAAQPDDLLFDALTHPAISYRTAPLHDPIAELARKLQTGSARLEYDAKGGGYLASLLGALRVPVESQMAVFSKTSLQTEVIAPQNPRTIFFGDDVAVAWPRGGFIEITAHDPQQGIQFYALQQVETAAPEFVRQEFCLVCHHSYATLDVPGLLVRSVAANADGRIFPQLANYVTDDRSPIEERWAGWYVTGRTGATRHLGNPDAFSAQNGQTLISAHTTAAESLAGRLDLSGYLTPYSDIAALLVFDHQARVTNLLTRVGWLARIATADGVAVEPIVRDAAAQLADALLFVDEAPLPAPMGSTSGFAGVFSAAGPFDAKGRSLRQLDLTTRLMRYPCSYMIYAAAFDGLPSVAKDAVYQRLWAVLSGADTSARYVRLSSADRRAIIEILRDTKNDLPAYFQTS